MFFYIDRMYIHEVAKLINREDVRTARKWCEKNGVTIHKDSFGEFIIKNDFDLAYDLPLIKKLKNQHGNNWEKLYLAYHNNEIYKFLDVNQNSKKTNSSYIPKGGIAKKLINKNDTNENQNSKI